MRYYTHEKTQRAIRRMAFTLLAFMATVALLGPIVAFAQTPHPYRGAVQREAQARFGVPPPTPVIAAQIHQESGWNPKAQSPVGAQGLMQFMPATARWVATQEAFGVVDAFNPVWSIRAGVWYDRWLYERVKAKDTCDRWRFALSGYNGGLGWVYKRQKKSPSPGDYDVTSIINPGIHPANQKENEGYAARIMYRHQPRYASWGKTECLL